MTHSGGMVSAPVRDGRLLAKFQISPLLARMLEGLAEQSSITHLAGEFDMDSVGVQRQSWNDYNTVRAAIKSGALVLRRDSRVGSPGVGLGDLGTEDNHCGSTLRRDFWRAPKDLSNQFDSAAQLQRARIVEGLHRNGNARTDFGTHDGP